MLKGLLQRRSERDPLVGELERRVDRLEAQLEALEDAVHRDAVRRDHWEADLERKTEPQQIARSLSDDARSRGLD